MQVYTGQDRLIPVEARYKHLAAPDKVIIRAIALDLLHGYQGIKQVISEGFLVEIWDFLNPKRTWDGRALSTTECRVGQTVPGFCGRCRKSPDENCSEFSKERALKTRERNIYGIRLPVDPAEKFPVPALQWSTVYEIFARIALGCSVGMCQNCNKVLLDGFPIQKISVQRLRHTFRKDKEGEKIPYSSRWTAYVLKIRLCSKKCLKEYLEKTRTFACQKCGRLAQQDTQTLKQTHLCKRCMKDFLLKNGTIFPDHSNFGDSMWSFAMRTISKEEALEAGFRSIGKRPLDKEAMLPVTNGSSTFRPTGHRTMIRLSKALERYSMKVKSPDK
jgi:hypothetical protein